LLLLSLLFLIHSSTGQKQNAEYTQVVHQYMVTQAWQYLKHNMTDINWDATPMASHVGNIGNNGDPNNPWDLGLITTGAFREDEEDPVYLVTAPDPTVTHFWRADIGDDWMFTPQPPLWGSFPNAYQKALNYINGQQKIFFQKVSVDPVHGAILGRFYSYNNLFDFYNTGRCYYWGYMDINWHYQEEYNPPLQVTIPLETSQKWSYCILGRVAHLLCDVGVPAHAHGDQHDPYWGGTDYYESIMNNFYTDWDYNLQPVFFNWLGPNAFLPLINQQYPLRYIFYLANQVGDRFSSNHIDGNTTYTPGYGGDNYAPWLQGMYNAAATIPLHASFPNFDYNIHTGDFSFCFGIKSVASLFYWFACETHQFPTQQLTTPTISSTLQWSGNAWTLYKGQTGTFYVQCPNAAGFQWEYTCENGASGYWPMDMCSLQTLTPNNLNYMQLHNTNFTSCSCSGETNSFWLRIRVRAYNCAGQSVYSQYYTVYPQTMTQPNGGCPWLFVMTDSGAIPDNNILHKSEFAEYSNADITDLYKLNHQPQIDSSGNIPLQIFETGQDYNYFDNVKLFAVDHPVATTIGVTENNQIVMFYNNTIQSTDSATIDGSSSITPFIQYDLQNTKLISGNPSDGIYAHYDSTSQTERLRVFNSNHHKGRMDLSGDSLALIGSLGHNADVIVPTSKNWEGVININSKDGVVSKKFARRELNSLVIVPYAGINDNPVDNIDVVFSRDYQVSYFCAVPVTYSGFAQQELRLVSATHSTWGDITYFLQNDDDIHAEMDTTAMINLNFNPGNPVQKGMIRDYVFQIKGKYTETSSNRMLNTQGVQNEHKEGAPIRYSLSNNYPNPFNPKTSIKYSIEATGPVKLYVFNTLGQLVIKLVDQVQNSGEYSVLFDGDNLASGVYFYKLETMGFTATKKMVLIK